MKTLLFILNPKSGKNQIKPHLCDIIDMYVAGGYTVTVHTTQGQKDAYEVAKTRGEQYDMVVCSGGDGTVDEVVSGIMELDNPPKFGYIPAGTTNDYARSLGIPVKMMEAARNTLEGAPYACDVGLFNQAYFIYVAAFGIFTDVAHQTPQGFKNLMGHMAYILEGIKSLTNIKSHHLHVEYDDGVIEDDFIYGMVTNSISVGGFKSIAGSEMDLSDGLFEMLFIYMPKNIIDLQAIVAALLMQKVDEEHMVFAKTKKVAITGQEEISWTLDGEDGGIHQNVLITNLQRAIEIIRPVEAIIEELEEKEEKQEEQELLEASELRLNAEEGSET